jgi:NADH-quinone oxidoreductase subunit H
MNWDTIIVTVGRIIGLAIVFHMVLLIVAYTVVAERKILGYIQGRLGPNRVGPWGLLQPFADLLKFIFKEDISPDASSKFLHFLAPLIATISAVMTVIVYPFGPTVHLPFINRDIDLVVTRLDVGLLYVLGVTSVGVYGIALAGWSSNNKYSLMGALRSSAQLISYELSLGLALVGVILQSGSLDLYKIVEQQGGLGGVGGWNIFWFQPLGFIVYLISAIAETNRVPFDLPEAETELVAGFHTEYSAMKFALFFLAEYINMFTVSMLAATLFLGGWNGPGLAWLLQNEYSLAAGLLGAGYFLGKVFFFLFLYIWIRGTLPRFRYDQLMNFGWKFLIPVALLNIVITALIQISPLSTWAPQIIRSILPGFLH